MPELPEVEVVRLGLVENVHRIRQATRNIKEFFRSNAGGLAASLRGAGAAGSASRARRSRTNPASPRLRNEITTTSPKGIRSPEWIGNDLMLKM